MSDWMLWAIGIGVAALLFDIHRRVSVTMDAVLRMEEQLNAKDSRQNG